MRTSRREDGPACRGRFSPHLLLPAGHEVQSGSFMRWVPSPPRDPSPDPPPSERSPPPAQITWEGCRGKSARAPRGPGLGSTGRELVSCSVAGSRFDNDVSLQSPLGWLRSESFSLPRILLKLHVNRTSEPFLQQLDYDKHLWREPAAWNKPRVWTLHGRKASRS